MIIINNSNKMYFIILYNNYDININKQLLDNDLTVVIKTPLENSDLKTLLEKSMVFRDVL